MYFYISKTDDLQIVSYGLNFVFIIRAFFELCFVDYRVMYSLIPLETVMHDLSFVQCTCITL